MEKARMAQFYEKRPYRRGQAITAEYGELAESNYANICTL